MPAPKTILELVERFERNRDEYRSGRYNETQVRLEFLNPFFEALGWDVLNKQGHAEAYKDVVHEDEVKVAGMTKAPDYAFRVGGVRKFFVEAKNPSKDLKLAELHHKLRVLKSAHDKTLLERQIAATDRQLDQVVHELYGLTEEEIGIMEEGVGR